MCDLCGETDLRLNFGRASDPNSALLPSSVLWDMETGLSSNSCNPAMASPINTSTDQQLA